MVFSSVTFLFLFLPILLLLNYLVRGKVKNYILLVASLIFYAWGEPIYVLLMIFSSLVNYALAFKLQQSSDLSSQPVKSEKVALVVMLVFNLGMLGVFKYTGFFLETINGILSLNIPIPNISLPIGISFYTFQTISYMIDVYRRDVKVQKSFANLLLFISFFPQLIAGPIIKYKDVHEQINKRKETWPKTKVGFKRFVVGLSKKVLIANQLALITDSIYNANAWGFASSWLVAATYMLQIYFDFSGYSDMAIGLALMFGFKFKENFNHPYLSQSVREFWRRWHISLSNWFKDYVYIPLGGSRVSTGRMVFNNFVVFFLTGLWHGASWNFVIWGLWQWVFIMSERFFLKPKSWWKPLRHIYTMLNVLLSFVIFRAIDMHQAFTVFNHMFNPNANSGPESLAMVQSLLTPFAIVIIIIAIFASTDIPKKIGRKVPRTIKNIGYLGVWFLSLMTLSSSTYNPFIYFRF